MTSTAARETTIGIEETMSSAGSCGCASGSTTNNSFFRGVMIAIPAGLLVWAGLLRVVGEVLHHL